MTEGYPAGYDRSEHQPTPHEAIVARVCQDLLSTLEGYRAAFSFGTPGGDDIDVRLCFDDLSKIDEAAVRQSLLSTVSQRQVDTEIDLLFMSTDEFSTGIRDLTELGYVEERLIDGFDPHVKQGAVGDTSLFSRYIFSSMRPLQPDHGQNLTLENLLDDALDRSPLTAEGGIGWSHFYMGCFIKTYLQYPEAERANNIKYQERIAKFFSRVTLGSTLAQLEAEHLQTIGPLLTAAVRSAKVGWSTDSAMSAVLTSHPVTAGLLDSEARLLLEKAGNIRNGEEGIDVTTLSQLESRLFYEAFQQGAHRRKVREGTDPLTAYALTSFLRDVGRLQERSPYTRLTQQGNVAEGLYYLPLKTTHSENNAGIIVVEKDESGMLRNSVKRPPGRFIGEAALFNLPSSATVYIENFERNAEVYFLPSETLRSVLTNHKTQQQLLQPVLRTKEARRLDVLLRYFALEASLFSRRIFSYAAKADTNEASDSIDALTDYDLGIGFHDTLHQLARQSASAKDETCVAIVSNSSNSEITLMEAGIANPYLYVVSEGPVKIRLQTGEVFIRNQGEHFGESSILGLPATGTVHLPPGASVVRINADWFMRFTQSRTPLAGPNDARSCLLPVQLLYHLAAVGYRRVSGRLRTAKVP